MLKEIEKKRKMVLNNNFVNRAVRLSRKTECAPRSIAQSYLEKAQTNPKDGCGWISNRFSACRLATLAEHLWFDYSKLNRSHERFI